MEISATGGWTGDDVSKHHGYSKALAHWIAGYLPRNKWVIDLGCGMGYYLHKLHNSGFRRLIGFEYQPPVDRVFGDVHSLDLTNHFELSRTGNIIFLEVGEHIPARHQNTVIANVAAAVMPGGKLIMSWAVRGQPGDGHVNCLDNAEVIPLFVAQGLTYLLEDTLAARAVIANEECGWFKNTLLIFERKGGDK